MSKIQTLMTNKEYRFFNVAKAIAKTSTYKGPHIGCCVVYKGDVISVAANCNKTHPIQYNYNKFRGFNPQETCNKMHAEVHAISRINSRHIDWKYVNIYTYRETRNGEPAISKPCEACSRLIKDLGIPFVYYIDSNGNFVKEDYR